MSTLSDILGRGFFPKELPNPFTTTSFATAVGAAQPGTLPGALSFAGSTKIPKGLEPGKLVKYSHARGGLRRRLLSIPNPIHYFLLCSEICKSWTKLQPLVSDLTISATAPKPSPKGRALQGAYGLKHRPDLETRTRLNNRFILKTDISRFYHSVYTHSIPWAILTKPIAKEKRSFTQSYANRLDYWVRMGQDQQTVGIPIGPDTSLLIAELVMQRCDREVASKLPGLRGHRYIDDYELGFRYRTRAEDSYHHLEQILGKYELALNPLKTSIHALPQDSESPWVSEITSFLIRTGATTQRADLRRYFDLAFRHQNASREEPVLQLAVARLRNLHVHEQCWERFQHLLLLAASPYPACLPYVLENIILRVNKGNPLDKDSLEEVLNTLIEEHACLPHSSEVAWSIWASIALDIPIHSDAVAELEDSEDSVVALLALHAESLGRMKRPLEKSKWLPHMTTEGLYDDQWLLAYEAAIKGWLPSQGGGDHVSGDPAFNWMRNAGVSFYDIEGAAPPTPGTAPEPKPPTSSIFLFREASA